MSLDLNHKFDSEEDIGKEFDLLVCAVREQMKSENGKVSVNNPFRVRQMNFAYEVMQYLTRDIDATVTCNVNKTFTSVGSVSVEGKLLKFCNSKWFARAAEFASNMEVYPLTKDMVRLSLTFHGLTVKER